MGFAQDGGGVDVAVADGQTLRAQYLVGCDGGRSIIRKAAGIDSRDWSYKEHPDRGGGGVRGTSAGTRRDEIGIHGLQRMEDGRTLRVMVSEQQLGTCTSQA